MPRIKSLSIRTILGILAISCILPVTLITLGLLWFDYQRDKDQLVDNTIAASRSFIVQVDQVFGGMQTSLITLATTPALWDPDRSKFYAQAQAIAQTQQSRNILLTETDGRQLVNTLVPLGTALPTDANQALVTALRTTHAAVVSDLFNSETDNQPVVSVGLPVIRDGAHQYNILCRILPSVFANLLSEQGLPIGYVAAITDRSGTIVARSKDGDKFIGKKVSLDLLNALLKKSEGYVNGRTLDGVPVVAGYSQSQATGWTVVIAIPNEILTRDLRDRVLALVAVTAIALMIGLGMAWLIGNRIIRANRGLIAPALALGNGKCFTVPDFGFREANEVGDALRRAGAQLTATQHKANHDNLTGLPNRGLFYEVVERQLRIAARNKTQVALLFIDLDGFKKINDRHGHATGDELLRQVAERLRRLLRASDVPSRLGGDEFAVALPDTTTDHAVCVAEKLIDGLSEPYHAAEQELRISASIGVAASGAKNHSVEVLVRAADDAMYVAKESGKGRVHPSQVA